MAESIHIDGRTVELSNTDKVLFPDLRVTKGDLIEYYRKVADTMLPHLRGRPVSNLQNSRAC